MNNQNLHIEQKPDKYHLEFRHITLLLAILVFFILVLMIVERSFVHDLLSGTQNWYKRHSAEILANTNATSLELLIENVRDFDQLPHERRNRIVQSFNIILTQQMLERNIKDICILVPTKDSVIALDDGKSLYNYLARIPVTPKNNTLHSSAIQLFSKKFPIIKQQEKIISTLKAGNDFEVLVPFAPHGELIGVFYMNTSPDLKSFAQEFLSNYNQLAIIFFALILLSLLTMYYISTYTIQERDKAQQKLFEEKQQFLKTEIEHQKEQIFTKRIYHTHHKAEKVMGFIKEDLRNLNDNNIIETKEKILKYANFVARAIYDMKWYEPPLQTIRNPIFNTDVNRLIKFIVENIFLRISSKMENIEFKMELSPDFPKVHINEFVVWEIIEPLIQNSIDHANTENLLVLISTKIDTGTNKAYIIIEDNGKGIKENLLEEVDGIQKVFVENVTTKNIEERRSGYGCYIAYELAVNRCGWKLRAENKTTGCKFVIAIDN
jgi:signal transduction histidine kinase